MGLDPTAIVAVPTFTASVPKPQVGTAVLAGDVTAVAQALTNRTSTIADVYQAFEVTCLGLPPWYLDTAGDFTVAPMTNFVGPTLVDDATQVVMPLDLWHGAHVRIFRLRIDPGAHVDFPDTMPYLLLKKYNSLGALVHTWSVQDSTSPIGSYNAAHDLVLDVGEDLVIDRGNTYTLTFVQEDGIGSPGVPGNIYLPRFVQSKTG